MRSILFTDLSVRSAVQKKQLSHTFHRVLTKGIFLHGPENARLVHALSRRFGLYINLVASGHDAILLALLALKLRPHDEVIVPTNAYPTAFAVALSGSQIKLADVDTNGQLSIETINHVRTRRTKVIVLVHLFGLTGDIQAIKQLCKKHNIVLIEDCAQAFGTTFDKKLVGTIGDMGCFSFYPTKNLGAFGDGGAIHTKSKRVTNLLSQLTQYGEQTRYQSMVVSGHSRIPEFQAAGLAISLPYLSQESRKKAQIYHWYIHALKKAKLENHVRVLISHPKSAPLQHLFVIEVDQRDALQKYLKAHSVPTLIHYPTPVHLVPAFRYLKHAKRDFPVSEKLCSRILSLPYYAYLSKQDVSYIIEKIRIFYETRHP